MHGEVQPHYRFASSARSCKSVPVRELVKSKAEVLALTRWSHGYEGGHGKGVGGGEMLSKKWIGQATFEKSETKFYYSGYKSKCVCVA